MTESTLSSPVHDAVKVMRGLEELFPENRFIERLRHSIEHFPDQNWEDAMSRGQVRSKQWLIHELISNGRAHLGHVAVCGGWLGTLSRMLLDDPTIVTTSITSIDTDACAGIAATNLNREYVSRGRFIAKSENCYHTDYESYDTIINTSCEHFADLYWWWENRVPAGKLVVLQSNDFLEPEDHVCTHDDLEDFVNNLGPMSQVIYTGTLPTHLYNRFMVIGVK